MAVEKVGNFKAMRCNKSMKLSLFLAVAVLMINCSQRQGKNPVQPVETRKKTEYNPPAQNVSIYQAALDGNLNQVLEMLQEGFDVNKTDQDGRTALMYAAFNGYAEIVKILLEKKAIVDMRDQGGKTALMFAASGPFPETVRLLLDHQANPNLADYEEHFTALMYAAAEGQRENVMILLEGNADPLLKDADGDMASSFARNNGHAEVVEILNAYSKK
jgi:uncharacterized protein